MDSSEEEEDFATHEYITPQTSITAVYQSETEKGIRKICTELLDLKDAIESLSGNMQSKFLAFLRISEEVVEAEHEIIELHKHVSSQGILVQDLLSGVCRELETWNEWNRLNPDSEEDIQVPSLGKYGELEDDELSFLETIDVLLAEHRVEEALLALEVEEKRVANLKDTGNDTSREASSYMVPLSEKKDMLVDQLEEIAERSSVPITELKKALSGLVRLGKGSRAQKLLLNAYGIRLHKKIENFLPLCSGYSETYSATLSQLVFSTISLAIKEYRALFEDARVNSIVQWAECEIESFVQLAKEHAPLAESAAALRSSCICLQASLSHCACLESQGLNFSKLLVVLLKPYVEEVIDMNFRRARRMVAVFTRNDEALLLSPEVETQLMVSASSNFLLTSTGKKFMLIVKDILEQLTPMAILHFGETILNKVHQLFDKYVEILIKALPSASEDDSLIEHGEAIDFRAETDAQQLEVLGTAYMVAEDLLPFAVSQSFQAKAESGNGLSERNILDHVSHADLKDWKRHLQHSLDKLKDHFCQHYVLNFIYTREDSARLDAHMYLDGKREDLYWDNDALPSYPFQALFGRLQQLASIAGDVLLGKEKVQKVLLARLTETVVIWLLNEQEFWDVFEDKSVQLQPSGLQQLLLDMYFIVEIAVCGNYKSRKFHQTVSAIITRAIGTFSSRGIDPQSALPEDEWFSETAKSAIHKLMSRSSGSESSEHDGHIIMHDDISDSDDTSSIPSDSESVESFVSANTGVIESPTYSSDHEG